MSSILVTGVAGFIGYHVAQTLLHQGFTVIGLDNLNPYYDVQLKRDRLAQLLPNTRFQFHLIDLVERSAVEALFSEYQPQSVIHLAAQAGVRYSLDNPHAYVDSNLVGFLNILEGCRHHPVTHLIFASSSSVYGANRQLPYSVTDNVDNPISLYAATKKANELMAHTYSHLYGIPTTGLRFFTVYGPWGRPDMAPFKFTKALLEGKAIDVYNAGQMKRDFTYIDDIVTGLLLVLAKPPLSTPDSISSPPLASHAPYRIYNLGYGRPVELMSFIQTLEYHLNITAQKNMLPLQPGDVLATWADIEDLKTDTGFKPQISIEEGIPRFINWYRQYYQTPMQTQTLAHRDALTLTCQ